MDSDFTVSSWILKRLDMYFTASALMLIDIDSIHVMLFARFSN